jgi:methylated-DNA-protein-cysteine methyltransferase related protein
MPRKKEAEARSAGADPGLALAVSMGSAGPGTPRTQAILACVRGIPVGFVRTYGDCSPGSPRVTGAVLAACEDPDVPWHRVVRADGSLAKGARQRALLDAEGVPFRGKKVDLGVARLPDL